MVNIFLLPVETLSLISCISCAELRPSRTLQTIFSGHYTCPRILVVLVRHRSDHPFSTQSLETTIVVNARLVLDGVVVLVHIAELLHQIGEDVPVVAKRCS